MIDVSQLEEFDPSRYLDTDEAVEILINDALETGDPKYVADALGVAAKAIGMTEIARRTGIRREQLYKALSPQGNPTLQTLLPVLRACGLGLSVKKTSPEGGAASLLEKKDAREKEGSGPA